MIGPMPLLAKDRLKHNLTGCLLVVCYILRSISENRAEELKRRLMELVDVPSIDSIREVIRDVDVNLL
ncbi:MAG: hypothetical protein NC114_09625 [Ruminococcus flavefaciens]|nr:hypothetical protein [Ruminococcus flavefaciens]